MFDIGFSEVFLVLVIGLILIGPERLPGVARKIGVMVRKARRLMFQLSHEFQRELDTEELNRKLAENNILPEAKEIKKEFEDIKQNLDDSDKKHEQP